MFKNFYIAFKMIAFESIIFMFLLKIISTKRTLISRWQMLTNMLKKSKKKLVFYQKSIFNILPQRMYLGFAWFFHGWRHMNHSLELPLLELLSSSSPSSLSPLPQKKTFAQALNNACDFPLSQLSVPCLKGDALAMKSQRMSTEHV